MFSFYYISLAVLGCDCTYFCFMHVIASQMFLASQVHIFLSPPLLTELALLPLVSLFSLLLLCLDAGDPQIPGHS